MGLSSYGEPKKKILKFIKMDTLIHYSRQERCHHIYLNTTNISLNSEDFQVSLTALCTTTTDTKECKRLYSEDGKKDGMQKCSSVWWILKPVLQIIILLILFQMTSLFMLNPYQMILVHLQVQQNFFGICHHKINRQKTRQSLSWS